MKDSAVSFFTSAEFAASLGDNKPYTDPAQVTTNKKRTISFNITHITSSGCLQDNECKVALGPLDDDGTSYSAIGFVELLLLQDALGHENDFVHEKPPDSLNGHTH